MTVDIISVGLDIKNELARAEYERIIAPHKEFRLLRHGDHRLPDLLILDMEEDRGKTFSRIHSILADSPSTEVFLTAPSTDSEVLLEALRAGVREFIPQPMTRHELEQALNRFKERHQGRTSEKAKGGKLITILGSKGGVGATTIAVNLAVSLRNMYKHRSVALVDLNAQFGDAALFLDMETAHSMADVAKNIMRLDATLLTSLLSRHGSGVYLLPSPKVVEEIGLITPESVQRTVELLKTLYDYIIIDSGHTLDDVVVTVLNMSPTILLVSGLTMPVLRNTRRILDIFSSLGYHPDAIKIIMNRYSKKVDTSLFDAEEVLKQKPFSVLPNDEFTTMRAINNGEPLSIIAPRAAITKSINRMVSSLTIDEMAGKKKSFLRRLLTSRL